MKRINPPRMPAVHPEVVSINSIMFANRLKPLAMCKAANIAPSTWRRWCGGQAPNLGTLDRLRAAVDVALNPPTPEGE